MRHPIHRLEHSLIIDRSLLECYRFIIEFEQYPTFIPNLKIEPKGSENVWQWTLRGIEGKEICWDLKIDGLLHENRTISWHTIRIADVAHNGSITLYPIDEQQTRLHFVVEYEPSANFYQASEEGTFTDDDFVQNADVAIVRALENLKRAILSQESIVRPF